MVLEAAQRAATSYLDAGAVVNRTDYVGEAYGIPSTAGLAAMRKLATTEGSARPRLLRQGFSGVIGAAQSGELRRGDSVVFVHTGDYRAFSHMQRRSWRTWEEAMNTIADSSGTAAQVQSRVRPGGKLAELGYQVRLPPLRTSTVRAARAVGHRLRLRQHLDGPACRHSLRRPGRYRTGARVDLETARERARIALVTPGGSQGASRELSRVRRFVRLTAM